MTGKRSPAKEQTAQQRQRKLAAALRTNLRRRKAQAPREGEVPSTATEATQSCDAPNLTSPEQ